MTSYEYQTLSGFRSFRILKLTRPCHDLELSTIHGELTEANLDSPPKYDAISYTWGESALVVPITCSGREMLITQSCAEVLRRFMRGKIERIVWVDGICINQKSIDERNQQVQVMGEIYAKAAKVLIWLGPATPASDLAMAWLKDLTLAFVMGRHQQKVLELHAFDAQNTAIYPFGLLGEIFRRPWFRRMWVIQEVAIAQAASIMFYCGDRMIHLINLFTAVNFSDVPDIVPSQRHWYSYPALLRMLKDAVDCKRKNEALNETLSLSLIMSLVVYKEATDPKDKIFALYGITNCLGWYLPMPDYHQPISRIYTDATRAAIEGERSLNILNNAAGVKSQPNLPSWVPDYSKIPETMFSPSSWFNAGRSSQISYRRSADSQELVLNGIFLDMIDNCGSPLMIDFGQTLYSDRTPPIERTEQILHVLQAWLFLAREMQYHLFSAEPADHAFARTVFMDTVVTRNPALVVSLYTSTLSPVLTQVIPENDAAARAHFSSDFFQRAFQNAVKTAIGRSFATTHAGRMANVPMATRPLDLVVIFAGAKAPCVIRQEDNGAKYTLIGSAFVHGIMDGECWNADPKQLQEFGLV